jgi:hypothetical protein
MEIWAGKIATKHYITEKYFLFSSVENSDLFTSSFTSDVVSGMQMFILIQDPNVWIEMYQLRNILGKQVFQQYLTIYGLHPSIKGNMDAFPLSASKAQSRDDS